MTDKPTLKEIYELRSSFGGPGEVNRTARLICDLAAQHHRAEAYDPPVPGLVRRATQMLRSTLRLGRRTDDG